MKAPLPVLRPGQATGQGMQREQESREAKEIGSILGQPPEQWEKYRDRPETETPSQMRPHKSTDMATLRIYDKIMDAGLERKDAEHPSDSVAEAEVLADLLSKLIIYQQHERLCAHDVVKHTWFHFKVES